MKVLVIGSGGREHALVHTFHRQGHKVYCLPGNPGTLQLTEAIPAKWAQLDPHDFDELTNFVKEEKIELTVCGPEAYLEEGIADAFNKQNLPFFGPTQSASRIECSKAWSKEFMRIHNIPTAKYVICTTPKEARATIHSYFQDWNGVVIKPSGLTAGKGVIVCHTLKEAEIAIANIMEEKRFGEAGKEVIIEELLQGKEVSLIAFADGNTMVPMIAAQDHKRLYDGNQGPNTGGIGAYAPAPFLDNETARIIKTLIIDKTCESLKNEKITYKGFLYFGLMLTNEGPKVLEYNCRLGDPETQVILPLLKSDLAHIMTACCQGRLAQETIEWSPHSACCIVMVSRGYPKLFNTGYEIHGLHEAEAPNTLVFHSGTQTSEKGKIVSAGGRVLGVTALAPTLEKAIAQGYDAVKKIHFEGTYYRSDIGCEAVPSLEAAGV